LNLWRTSDDTATPAELSTARNREFCVSRLAFPAAAAANRKPRKSRSFAGEKAYNSTPYPPPPAMKLVRVRQKLVSNPLADVRAAVQAALDGLAIDVPQGDVGITAGQRAIGCARAGRNRFYSPLWARTTAAPLKASGR
jgi:hypothetical protein